MDKKLLFNDALTSLIEFAAANANHVSKEDIHTIFNDVITDESQYDLIYKYLQESKVKIDGMDYLVSETITDLVEKEKIDEKSEIEAVKHKVVETQSELGFIEMYKAEIDSILPTTRDEINCLVTKLLEGDTSVTNRLVETKLALVADIASTFRGQGVTYGDLIQEGNMGLMLALADFNASVDEFDKYISDSIHTTLNNIVNEQINSSRVSEHLANRMNELDEVSKSLTEELGHAPSFDELAKKLGISTSEVETIVKTSLNVLNSGDSSQDDVISEAANEMNASDTDDLLMKHSVDAGEFGSSSLINNTEDELDDFEDGETDIGDPISWRINK